jgi:AcrR family transcriptional regulator
MDDVAAASGYSPAAIYKYFRNKDELFSRLWTGMADKLQAIFDESVHLPMPFAMRLRWLVVRASQLLETSPNLLVAFIAQRPYAARARSALEKQALRHYREHQARIVELMQKGIEEGVLREGGAQEYSLLLIGLLYEFAHRWVMDDGRMDVGEAVDRIVDLFLRGAGRAGRC